MKAQTINFLVFSGHSHAQRHPQIYEDILFRGRTLSKDEKEALFLFGQLNGKGKLRALELIGDIAGVPKYRKE